VLVALVPLLWAWRGARPRHAALYGFAFGVACYGVVIPWIRYFGYVALFPLVVAMAAAIAVVGALVASLATRRLASPFLTAAAWVALEALRGRWPLGGFPWADLGISLHDVAVARALASFGGALLVTFVVVAVNGCVLELALAVADHKTRAGALSGAGLAAAGLAGLLLVTVVADVARYEPRTTGHLRVALLQGDDEQLPLADQTNQLLTAKHLALAGQLHGHYDLIVFPESALDTDPETDPGLREQLTTIAAEHGASVLVNARTLGPNNQYRNTNRLYTPTGRLQGSYSKQHLVPFGEYVPWRDQLSFLRELRQIPYDFQVGNSRTIFHIAGHPLGSVICFESAFAPLVRDYVRDGAQVIVVSTNNRSYQRSANSEQHLASSQMRAAETGRPVLQASVSGISAVIEPDGTVHDATNLFQPAIVTATIPTTTGETPYVRFGDWVVLDCALALLVVTVIAVRRPVTSPGA
jgi:apolipoprotein N-acyltransferase